MSSLDRKPILRGKPLHPIVRALIFINKYFWILITTLALIISFVGIYLFHSEWPSIVSMFLMLAIGLYTEFCYAKNNQYPAQYFDYATQKTVASWMPSPYTKRHFILYLRKIWMINPFSKSNTKTASRK